MHAVVMERLEEYLSGMLKPASHRKIEAHLRTCEMCRDEIRNMQEVSALFGSLRTEEAIDPAPGFYARVVQQVGERKAAPSFTTLFSLDLSFARRLAFASLLTLAVLGGYLVTLEADYAGGPSPDLVMAQQESPMFESAPARDNMLVTLTAYEH